MKPEDRFDFPNYHKPIRTEFSEKQGAQALFNAWFEIYQCYPTLDQLAVLLAKVCLETGRFRSCYNFNFGNIKCDYKKDQFTMYKCGELLNGKWYNFNPPHIQTVFRSYESLDDGAKEYIEFVSQRRRYLKAWQEVIKGDPSQYVVELKKAHYFTAPLEPYRKSVVSLFKEYKRKIQEWKIGPEMTQEEIEKYQEYQDDQFKNLVLKTILEKT